MTMIKKFTEEEFQKQLRDVSSLVKRITTLKQPKELLKRFTDDQLETVSDKLKSYNPKTDKGQNNRHRAKEILLDYAADIEESKVKYSDIGQKINEETVVLEISISQPSYNHKMNSDSFFALAEEQSLDSDAKKKFAIRQEIIDKKKYASALENLKINLLNTIKGVMIRTNLFSGGKKFLIPFKYVVDIDEKIEEFIAQRNVLLDEFESQWDEAVQEARDHFGKYFVSEKYPPFSYFREKYTIKHKFLSFKVKEALREISPHLYNKEKEKFAVELGNMAEEVRMGFREQFNELIGFWIDTLSVDEESGKPKTFHKSKIDGLQKFLSDFEDQNITDDAKLMELVKTSRDILEGRLDATKLRKDGDFREETKQVFEKLKTESVKLMTTRQRKIKL